MLKLVGLVLSWVGDAIGISVAAALLPNVSSTPTGVVVGAACLAGPMWLYFEVTEWVLARAVKTTTEEHLSPLGCIAVPLLFFSFLLPVPLLFLAAAVAPGLAVSGFWSYVVMAVVVTAVSVTLWAPYFAIRRLRR